MVCGGLTWREQILEGTETARFPVFSLLPAETWCFVSRFSAVMDTQSSHLISLQMQQLAKHSKNPPSCHHSLGSPNVPWVGRVCLIRSQPAGMKRQKIKVWLPDLLHLEQWVRSDAGSDSDLASC